MADLEAKKKKRQGVQAWLKRAIKSCEILMGKELKQVPQKEFTAVLENLEKRLRAWEEAQTEVEQAVDAKDIEEEVDSAADFYETVAAGKLSLEMAWEAAHPPIDVPQAPSENGSSGSRSSGPNISVRLPKLDLPTFDGDVTKFTPFWQQFGACVDEQEIPVVTKFNYLIGLLKGDAKSLLEGLPVTRENYEEAKGLLKKRYGRKAVIVFAHIQALLRLEVPDVTDVKELSKFYDRLVANVRALEALEVTADQFGVVLTPVIVSRLPEDIRMEWSRDSVDHEADLTFLMDFLETEIQRRERCRAFGGLEIEKKNKDKQWKQSSQPGTAAALHTNSGSKPRCFFCEGAHHSTRCYKFLENDIEKRKEWVVSKRLCFRCLSNYHYAKACRKKCTNCSREHHAVLCPRNIRTNTCEKVKVDDKSTSDEQQTGVGLLSINQSVSFLPTARVEVQCRDGSWQSATLLFDSGADRSYVSKSLVSKVGPKWVRNTSVSFATFGGRNQGSRSKVFQLGVRGRTGSRVDINVCEIPVICLPLHRPTVHKRILEAFDVELADEFSGGELCIDILIGQDLFWSLMKDGLVRHKGSNVSAQESVFGWVLSGSHGQGTSSGVAMLNISSIPDDIVSRFWDLESIGVSERSDPDSLVERFCAGVEYKDGRYEVGLTWREKHPPLLDNKPVAIARLRRLEKRLEKEPALREGYDRALQDMEDSGFIEEVCDGANKENLTFYLPHHPHVREESVSTKIRPVFDGSCKGRNGVSLNDCLDAGPNLNPCIANVILRFRRWRYAITADVKKAFLQIGLKEEDQDVHRFVVRRGNELRIMKFVRVAFGVSCSPFLLAATIWYHLSKYPSSFTVQELSENLYVDDFLSGADSEAEVRQLHMEASRIMDEAGMQLAKWSSNESSVMGGCIEGQAQSQYVKVLGVSWKHEQDMFGFVGAELPDPVRYTKRGVLSLLARMFDPLGFVLPFTVTARFLFQDIWRLGLAWDEDLPKDLQTAFKKWLDGLETLKEVSIPRSFFKGRWTGSICNIELHAFGDASLKGYGACVYMRYRDASGGVQCTLVRSCARVAPMERKTLPRLELLGCLVTAQLLNSVIKTLHLEGVKYTCWSDSMVALGWIRGLPSKWKQWVANRVTTIQGLTNLENWRHVAGLENPADLVTRGVSGDILLQSKLWWQGPSFLLEPELSLPVSVIRMPDGCKEVEAERKKSENNALLVCPDVESVIPFHRWSSLSKAYRVIAWVIRFINRARKKGPATKQLSADEFVAAKEVFVSLS